jgi:hypothetical protein
MFGVFFIAMVIIVIMAWLVFDKWNEVAGTNAAAIGASAELTKQTAIMQNKTNEMIDRVSRLTDSIAQANRGSGLSGG